MDAKLNPTTEEIREYLFGLIQEADGNGLVTTDDRMIELFLQGCGNFLRLRSLFDTSTKINDED